MFATLINDAAPAEDGFSLVQVVTVFVAFAVVWPLLSRLRRALSERRRTRWSADEAEAQTDDWPARAQSEHRVSRLCTRQKAPPSSAQKVS